MLARCLGLTQRMSQPLLKPQHPHAAQLSRLKPSSVNAFSQPLARSMMAGGAAAPAPVLRTSKPRPNPKGAIKNWLTGTPVAEGTVSYRQGQTKLQVGHPGHWCDPYPRSTWLYVAPLDTNDTDWDHFVQSSNGLFDKDLDVVTRGQDAGKQLYVRVLPPLAAGLAGALLHCSASPPR
jgi:hypothetical protein